MQLKKQHPVAFRISIDSPNETSHDLGRGTGNFAKAFVGMRKLYENGFSVSLARHISNDEDESQVTRQFQNLFELNGLPKTTNIVAFPDFLPPGSVPHVPHITTHCMTAYQTETQRNNYMCANSKMIIKKNDAMQVYACTLVDDDEDYFLGSTLIKSMPKKSQFKTPQMLQLLCSWRQLQ